MKYFGFWITVLLLMPLVTACAAPAGSDTRPVMRYVNFKVYDPVYVAIDRGYFADHGLTVEIAGDTLGGPTAIQAVAAGSMQAGLSSIPALINANAAGLPVQGVTDIQSALPGQPLEYYYVRKASDIHTVTDLTGRRFAVNLWRSSFHYTALMALEQHGLAEADVTFTLLPFEAQPEALIRGDVDVIGLMEPYNASMQALYGDDIRLLFTAEDVFGQKQFTLHFVNREWATVNPDQARAFVAGIRDAIRWIHANPDAARPIIARYTGVEEQFIPDYRFQQDGRVIMEDVAWWLETLQQRGDVVADDLTPAMIATNAYQ